MSDSIDVRAAALTDLGALADLFEQYRAFYDQPADAERAKIFLGERLRRTDSAILVAEDPRDRSLVGFVQLYPSFSSLRMARALILNDLFVHPEHRRGGVARALMNAALQFARISGAASISLETQRANVSARALYDSLGYHAEEEFVTYSIDTATADPSLRSG